MFRFSTSPNRSGFFEIRISNPRATHTIGMMSFIMNIGLNLILSMFVFVPVGFEDPVSCRAIRCTMTAAAISIGIRK